MSVHNPPCPEPDGCCEGAECTFTIRIQLNLCYDDDAFPPTGPTNQGWPNFMVSGTITYGGVVTPFEPILISGGGVTTPPIDRIDDEEEVTIQLDPVTINPPDGVKPDSCFATVVYEFDPITLVPLCGNQTVNAVGTKTQGYHSATAKGCTHGLVRDIDALGLDPLDYLGEMPGLRGGWISIATDGAAGTSDDFERLLYVDPCEGNVVGTILNSEYRTGFIPFTGVATPGTRYLTYTFNPPPGIPGYRFLTYDVSNDQNLNTGPLDTCGLPNTHVDFASVPSTPLSFRIVDYNNYTCHCRGFPIAKAVDYSDGFFSGRLSLIGAVGDTGPANYQGVLTAFCAEAFTIQPTPVPCCAPGGGTVQALITVTVCSLPPSTVKPAPIDYWNYYAVTVSKVLPLCALGICPPNPPGPLISGLLAGVTPGPAVTGTSIKGTTWTLYPADYTPLIASVPLDVPALPAENYPCLRGVATITEVV